MTGPILAIFGAHSLLMRHYHDDEAQDATTLAAEEGSRPGARPLPTYMTSK